MTPCPKCHGDAYVLESTVNKNGSRRRRHACSVCRYRWTTHQGERPHRWARLTPEGVERIQATVNQLQAELGCSRKAIVAALWNSQSEPTTATAAPSCLQCQHWADRCGMGFPDPDEEGPAAAQWCSCYRAVST
jgi:hypothetical protein